MIGWLNLGSLVLGLVAWILPVVNLIRNTKQINNNWLAFSFIISLSACSISLFFQVYTSNLRVKDEDWSALMDVMGTKVSVAAVLLIVTIVLNGITLLVYRNKTLKR
ncbi:hypothetical protein [Paucisalibacillus sp. EB02]|uniref:hypothetical protein n=1 Tax=Paucisalibacillus sp. EB02 TaxID=1347087 RepID=UPI0004B0DA09|nr:hypothetical protein [Paucisalibacillus sp. EB02]